MNIAPTEIDVHPKERKPNGIGQRPEERDLFARMLGHGLTDVHRKMEPDNADLFTWWAPWRNNATAQHRLAPGLCPRRHEGPREPHRVLVVRPRVRHERSRAGVACSE
jgi:hypothetical protein